MSTVSTNLRMVPGTTPSPAVVQTGTASTVAIPVGPEPVPTPPSTRQNWNSPFPKKILAPNDVISIVVPAATKIGGNTLYGNATIAAAGRRFTILWSNLPMIIQPKPGGRAVTYYPGMTVNFNETFDALIISNPSTTTQLVAKLWVGWVPFENYTPPRIPVTATETMCAAIAVANTVQQAFASDLYFSKGFFWGYSALNGATSTNNQGNVYIGKSSSFLPDYIAPGARYPIEVPAGQWLNLSSIYIAGANVGDNLFFSGT